MEYRFEALRTRTHLHVIGYGANSVDNIRRLLADMNRVFIETRLDALLLELRFSGPSVGIGDAYSIIFDNRAHSLLVRRIAYVNSNTEHSPERTEFAELAAKRLGLNARAFRTVAEAEEWLSA